MKEQIENIIEEALRVEPTFQLRKDFKDRVVMVIKKKEQTNQRRLYLWMVLGTLVIFGFGYAIIAYFMPSVLETFGTMSGATPQFVPIAVLIGLLIMVIQYLDKRLVKDKIIHI